MDHPARLLSFDKLRAAMMWLGIILATAVACLLTYQLLVRYTLIGVLLNGRRQPKAAPMPEPATVEPS